MRSTPWFAVLVLLLPGSGRGQSVVFSDFSSTTGLTLTSSSTRTTSADGTVVRLVTTAQNDKGGAFVSTQRSVTGGFSTAFEFRLSNRGGTGDGTAVGADGVVFAIQREAVNALGLSGEGMGFLNIGTASLGIEFDTYKNINRSDPSSNHVGVNTGGSVTSVATADIAFADFDNGGKWTSWIDYNGTTLEVRVSNTGTRPTIANLSYNLTSASLETLLGGTAAWVGFTAATGGDFARHDILSWTFSDQFIAGGVTAGFAVPVPEPGTYVLLALGLGALCVRSRTFRRGR